MKCFALCVCVFPSSCFSTVVFVFVCLGVEEEECSYNYAPSGSAQSQIDKQDAFRYFLSTQSLASQDADRERLALLEVWLMGSVPVSGSLSARRIAEGHCVYSLASSALLLYRNALIDIPEVLINKRTNSFLTLTGFALLLSFFFLAFNRVC